MCGQEWQTLDMKVEMIGGQYDGLRFTVPEGMTEITWEEPTWTGRRWTYTDSTMYRAPVTPLLKDGQPTGRYVVYYKYRLEMHSTDSSI